MSNVAEMSNVAGGNIILQPTTTKLIFRRGQQWITPTNYRFAFQTDGNLVLYNSQNKPIWATGTTHSTAADGFAIQTDGNVVLYGQGKALWATDTSGHPGAYLAIQTDGNIVVYDPNHTPLFATHTTHQDKGTLSAAADWRNAFSVKRGKVWVDKGIPYSQSAYYQGYRTDCSGFVSMAWQLSSNGKPISATTATLPNYSKTLNSKDDLKPGDAINNRQASSNNGHVVLFVQWINKDQGRFIAYEENGGADKAVKTELTLEHWGTNTWNIPNYPNHAPWYLERKQ